ncbi:hypothetical protein [Mucilaginibacter sp. BT774]|uniref:hypothetical protein n=1 Tax=Mucilaginibacter sp. BT774 TaxID=3062276 RepID=UPI002675CB49|nr:hypothetical protein [Mucilaginibacter sp. BT774]MDO3627856.1 hypothetical protein [Mucilaginibacter sp. BT774]
MMKLLAILFLLNFMPVGNKNQRDNIAGTWKGTSICQVKDSPCHDEIAIYHATKGEGNTYRFQMNKMVNGKEEEMGETVFTYDTNNKTLDGVTTSAKGKGLWHFVVKGNNMHGTLIVDNNVLYRLIDLHKD